MVVQPQTSHPEIVRRLRGLAATHQSAVELWWQSSGDELCLWLIADPQDYEEEKALHRLHAGIARMYPDLLFDLDVVNMRYLSDDDATGVVPRGAHRIPIRDG